MRRIIRHVSFGSKHKCCIIVVATATARVRGEMPFWVCQSANGRQSLLKLWVINAKIFQYFVLVITVLKLKVGHMQRVSPKPEMVHVLNMSLYPLA